MGGPFIYEQMEKTKKEYYVRKKLLPGKFNPMSLLN
jgi:hypothetical protein